MTSQADFVIVGAGQNQLSAAAYLAASGHSVAVFEKHPYVGGGCITREATVPGFKHDLHATNVFMARANPLLRLDELQLFSRFGLRFAKFDAAAHGTVFEDGTAVALYTDLDRSCESIARYSPQDARAYRSFIEGILKYVRLLSFALFSPPADGMRFAGLLNASDAGRYLMTFLDRSVIGLVDEHFTDVRTKVHVLRLATEMMIRPDSPGSAFGLLLMAGLYHTYEAGFVLGGSQGFADALARCIVHHGGAIHTDSMVTEVIVEKNRAIGVRIADGRVWRARLAVIAGLPPWRLSDFVAGTDELSAQVRKVANSDFTCFLTHVALKEAPRSIGPPDCQKMGFTVVAPKDLAAMIRMTRDAAAGTVPADFSACYVCATHFDPSRAPAGNHTLYLYRIVPTVLHAEALNAWDTIAATVGQEMIEQTRRYVPNLTPENMLGVLHTSPADFQRESPSFLNGDVAALAMTPEQFFGGRPTLALADYRVPGIGGLYLCGPFMHPGGGANGGGRPVAMRVMMDLGINLSTVFKL